MNIRRSMLACAAALAASMSAAYAGPCSPEITQVQEQIDASMHAKAGGVATAPESKAEPSNSESLSAFRSVILGFMPTYHRHQSKWLGHPILDSTGQGCRPRRLRG
jgi:hypothetical protein